MPEFKLPDVGEGLTEAEIVSWHVKVGDTVAVNDVVVEIETAKSLVELPSPYAGTVSELLVPAGETVAVGTPIISIGAAVAPAPDEVVTPPTQGAVEPGLIGGPAPGGRTSVLVGYGPRTTEARRRARKGAAVPNDPAPAAAQRNLQTAFSTAQEESPELPVEEATSALPEEPDAVEAQPGTVRVLAKPPVRKLAKDLGVDLREVTPSGPDGVVTRADVHAHAAAPAQLSPVLSPAAATSAEDRREPVRGVRKLTAQAMVTSAFTAPHVTEWVTIDVSPTMDLVERLRTHPQLRERRLSPLLVVAKAVCLALRHHPALNATFDDAAQEIVYKGRVNLGIAAATPRGLVVPNIKNADALPLAALATALDELVTTARAGRTQSAEMAGGTFTITNVGVFGVDAGTPILNPGETGILAVGAISRRPWVVGPEERIQPRWVTTLALSFDHRVVDGEQGSRFLADVAAILTDPAQALLY